MPKASSKSQPRIVYPAGVKDITDDTSTDDLVRRLKECAQAFQNMSQDDDNDVYVPLALHLATDYFIQHPSKDVRLLIACCIADVFRVFAPEAPYKDPEHLKIIFEFFIQQLRGLEDPKDPTFKRYFYLLENLAWVKSFNICIELEENQAIFSKLYELIFNIVNDNHSIKVKNFMLDMMCPLISEADSVSQELLDNILCQIIEPRKSQNKNSYNLAKDILMRTHSIIEPYIQAFFNNALILGKTSQSTVASRLYDLIYELNTISPIMLVAVLPQLEFKLKSNDEKERLDVTRLLARMFSDKNSDMAVQSKPLWTCFLGRFNDISLQVRIRCVQYSMHFLINHPELRDDITEQLRLRQHDSEETVRYEVVMAIISAAKKDFDSVTDELLTFVKERTLDKKFKIRKEALQGLAVLYKQHMSNPNIAESTLDCISWIKNKVLHVYYQTVLEDRLLVEKILHTCLVPYQLPLEERMKKLYQLFVTVDDYAVKAFNELLKCQNVVRNQVKGIVEVLQQPKSEEKEKTLMSRIVILSKNLPEPVKCQEYIKKFCNMLENNARLRGHMHTILSGKASCTEAENSVKEVLKSLGFPVQTNSFYMTVKQMLERVAPVMIDHAGILQILHYVKDGLLGDGDIDRQLGLIESAHRGLQLLHTLACIFPATFYGEEVFNDLLCFLKMEDEQICEMTLQVLTNVGADVERDHPSVAARLLPLLQNFIENGTPKQAKHAVACLNIVTENKERVFGQILDRLKQHLTLESQYYRTALVSIGHIAHQCPDLFGPQIKSIVSKIVVKELLMLDQDYPRNDQHVWCKFDDLPEETKVKVEGMKMMVRWLMGLKTATHAALSTMRLFSTVILHHGDLMERKIIAPMEKSWLRLTASTSMLKLCQEQTYADIVSLEQFQILALVINDECSQVREMYAMKLHKGLYAMKLPIEHMAVFALAGLEKSRDLKVLFKRYLVGNINKRREYIKSHALTTLKLTGILPDYVLPVGIHLLAHDPSFKQYDDVPSLLRLKDCLWFLMEPLMQKNETYSFSFFKRLIENIKQTKDKQDPNNELVNRKLYAVCDLAVGLVISKTTNFVLKDFPGEPVLPTKFYTDPDSKYSNWKSYLPVELKFYPPKKSGFEMVEMYDAPVANKLIRKVGRPRADAGVVTRGRHSSNAETNGGGSKIDLSEEEEVDIDQPKKKLKMEDIPDVTLDDPDVDDENSEVVDDPKAETRSVPPKLQSPRPRGRPRKNPPEATAPTTSESVASNSRTRASTRAGRGNTESDEPEEEEDTAETVPVPQDVEMAEGIPVVEVDIVAPGEETVEDQEEMISSETEVIDSSEASATNKNVTDTPPKTLKIICRNLDDMSPEEIKSLSSSPYEETTYGDKALSPLASRQSARIAKKKDDDSLPQKKLPSIKTSAADVRKDLKKDFGTRSVRKRPVSPTSNTSPQGKIIKNEPTSPVKQIAKVSRESTNATKAAKKDNALPVKKATEKVRAGPNIRRVAKKAEISSPTSENTSTRRAIKKDVPANVVKKMGKSTDTRRSSRSTVSPKPAKALTTKDSPIRLRSGKKNEPPSIKTRKLSVGKVSTRIANGTERKSKEQSERTKDLSSKLAKVISSSTLTPSQSTTPRMELRKVR